MLLRVMGCKKRALPAHLDTVVMCSHSLPFAPEHRTGQFSATSPLSSFLSHTIRAPWPDRHSHPNKPPHYFIAPAMSNCSLFSSILFLPGLPSPSLTSTAKASFLKWIYHIKFVCVICTALVPVQARMMDMVPVRQKLGKFTLCFNSKCSDLTLNNEAGQVLLVAD